MASVWAKVFKDCFTGVDNETYDIGRILIAISFFALVGFQAFEKKFDPWNFSSAVGMLLGTGGILLKIKETTEPKKGDVNATRSESDGNRKSREDSETGRKDNPS